MNPVHVSVAREARLRVFLYDHLHPDSINIVRRKEAFNDIANTVRNEFNNAIIIDADRANAIYCYLRREYSSINLRLARGELDIGMLTNKQIEILSSMQFLEHFARHRNGERNVNLRGV
ncbi:uncharacterized protein LOC107981935 [Nasonia vitripennis]|uniref:Uncharacterized protein n=1 Tax=Nasonia vitripennis TaxID=7425 RepID=A0A7M7ITF8_NASVI|nr:uncharacterized protein LOC107980516 [Nasonia vitripennis]XP_016844312.1 uncharacterized protein LOC107981935 [Nasonia vitripennis]